VCWYAGAILTRGLVPKVMAAHYYPKMRAARRLD
jgi:hypothetical protein